MIYAIVNRAGYGKSLLLTSQVRKYLDLGEDCYCNIPIDERVFKLKGKNLGILYHLRSMAEFHFIHNGIIFIDEMPSYFDARDFSKLSADDRMKFQQHRHDKLDIFYTSQVFGRVDIVIRQVTHEVWEVNNLFGLIFWYNRYDALDYEKDYKHCKKLNRIPKVFLFSKRIGNAYNTYQWASTVQYVFQLMSDLFNISVMAQKLADLKITKVAVKKENNQKSI